MMSENVTTDRLHDQCVYEIEIADQVRAAPSRTARMPLYHSLNLEYAKRFPEHLPTDSSNKDRTIRFERAFLNRFLRPTMTIAEVGPGRCHLAFALAPTVVKFYGIDVAESYIDKTKAPPNFELRLSDGISMPLPTNSVDLVISNQLMEHLHPDDAGAQLQEIHRILKPGGSYLCVTPSPINGPHDCSAYFDDLPCAIIGRNYMAHGLHLKEYTTSDILTVFRSVGFTRVQTWIGARGHYISVPSTILKLIESAIELVPADRRKRSSLLGAILGNRVCATK